jgi:hypothetical protein
MKRERNVPALAAVLSVWLAVVVAIPSQAGDAPGTAGPQLVLLKEGTRVDETPSCGWSHLILKSLSKIESGDVDTLPSFAASTATLFRSVILADIRPKPVPGSGFTLNRVGLGLCVSVQGKDTVVSEENADSPPFSLGFVETQVLGKAQTELKKARLIASTETFAVLAAPSELKIGTAHRNVILTYVMLVDKDSGRLDTLLWAISAKPERRAAPSSLTLLPPRFQFQCGLDVIADRLLGTLPISWSFAMCSLPPGRAITTPQTLRPWLVDPHAIASRPDEFERLIRAEVKIESSAHNQAPPSR